ncbi:MAG: hypothetical protein H7Y05_07720 [Steroidobacteraceae bacterium]|nr:hypothetical protein [Deltaproteobacteria bacterium]
MATVNYSVPDDVKELFNTAFAGANRSAVISELMRQAAEHELSLKRRREAVDALLEECGKAPQVSRESVSAARDEVRH